MHFCFVSTNRGSPFMTELLGAIEHAIAAAGHTTELALDRFPATDADTAYVVIPHEFRAWADPLGFPSEQQRARTIALCTENPGTQWFDETLELAPDLGAAISINRSSASELRRRGVPCGHLQLGYSPLWDRWHGRHDTTRDIDVLYLGAADHRRDPLLGSLGTQLWEHTCQFLVPPLEQRTRPRPDFLLGEQKYERLRSAETLLNLHRATSSALEWMRFLEAMCNGCIVVSEPCADPHPLIPGEHFVVADAGGLPRAIDLLLADPERLNRIRDAAYNFITRNLTMAEGVEPLMDLASSLPRKPAESGLHFVPNPAHVAASAPAYRSDTETRNQTCAPTRLTRTSRYLRSTYGQRTPIIARTPAHSTSRPRVSVLCPMRSDQREDTDGALELLAAAEFSPLEVVLMVGSERDRTADLAGAFLKRHPSLPGLIVGATRPSSLGRMRNALVRHARGEYVLFLEPEGGLQPSALTRLVDALDANQQAIFAFAMVAVFRDRRPIELRGSLPWEPDRLAAGGWSDGMALIRRRRLIELGGYTADESSGRSADVDFLRKCARAGGTGVHVPQVLSWLTVAETPVQPAHLLGSDLPAVAN